ncbi:hypothetical protein OG426_34230 [Streptomyces canus]|uniref:hypothetical protein n=1 Tax=Streptomyces canus TaxID=58343 RepID=UPI00386C136B|nr:hypothetical protein OG426_34230 [Streptomyces canus]
MPFDTTRHHDTGDYHDGPLAIPRRQPPGTAGANGAADPMAGAAGGTVASAAGHRPARLPIPGSPFSWQLRRGGIRGAG